MNSGTGSGNWHWLLARRLRSKQSRLESQSGVARVAAISAPYSAEPFLGTPRHAASLHGNSICFFVPSLFYSLIYALSPFVGSREVDSVSKCDYSLTACLMSLYLLRPLQISFWVTSTECDWESIYRGTIRTAPQHAIRRHQIGREDASDASGRVDAREHRVTGK